MVALMQLTHTPMHEVDLTEQALSVLVGDEALDFLANNYRAMAGSQAHKI